MTDSTFQTTSQEADQHHLLTLLALPGLGEATLRTVRQSWPDGLVTLDELQDLLCTSLQGTRCPFPSMEALRLAYGEASNALAACRRLGITVLSDRHPAYPRRIAALKTAPFLLYAVGDIAALSLPASVAIIGTRQPSATGKMAAEKFGDWFARRGFAVVTGLATGCDTLALTGCLGAFGRTVAVLAHGLDTLYPTQNRLLASTIAGTGGCLVSEHPPGVQPQRRHFVHRNRLQSALSAGVVVVETDVRGGTMHTVRFGLEQGKPLGCFKHPKSQLSEPKAQGNQLLLKSAGAQALSTAAQVNAFVAEMRHYIAEEEVAAASVRSRGNAAKS